MKYVYVGKEIILVEVARARDPNKNMVILGNGFSIGDPGFSVPKGKKFQRMGTVFAMFFKKECSGLEAAQQELADFIKTEYDNYENVVLYGHSKCGVMFYNTLSLIEKPVTCISVSAPFNGTFWADTEQVKKSLWTDRSLMQKLFKGWQYALYRVIFSNHAVDQDIIPGSEYLEKERAIKECHKAVFVVSQCRTFWREIAKGNFRQAFFSKMNCLAGYKKGDGIVSVESQFGGDCIKYNGTITASHMTSFNEAIFVLRYNLL